MARQLVFLHADGGIVSSHAAAIGRTGDAGAATLLPGVSRVQILQKGAIENVPGELVSDILIYDEWNGIGLHLRPMDTAGILLDAALGEPATAGCVSVGDSTAVCEFTRLGMWVWVHSNDGPRIHLSDGQPPVRG